MSGSAVGHNQQSAVVVPTHSSLKRVSGCVSQCFVCSPAAARPRQASEQVMIKLGGLRPVARCCSPLPSDPKNCRLMDNAGEERLVVLRLSLLCHRSHA